MLEEFGSLDDPGVRIQIHPNPNSTSQLNMTIMISPKLFSQSQKATISKRRRPHLGRAVGPCSGSPAPCQSGAGAALAQGRHGDPWGVRAVSS